MRAWIAAAALVAIVDGGIAAAEQPGFRIGPWEAASSGVAAGLPVICGAAMHQGGNESLGLLVDIMGRMWFVAASPKWNVAPGRPVGALLSFDEGPRESAMARVSDPRELRFDVAAAGEFEARLRRAGRIAIYA